MKVLFYTDVHWSQNSSIVRGRGTNYSIRLENLIKSVNWAEQLAWNTGCSAVICGGDFFDSSQLNSEEISALRCIEWAPISHVFLTGNHETNISSLEYSTSDIFNLCPNSVVISKPEHYHITDTDVEFCFLPYILERDRNPLKTYFPEKIEKRIIISHNDLKDVQYGPFLSTEGFTVSEIESCCDLFLNGHIHHCGYVTPKIINGGNLTGQNFTEDAYKFEHCVQVIDTTTLHVDFYINPHAFNFYKCDYTALVDIKQIENNLNQLKDNAVITIKVKDCVSNDVKQLLTSNILSNVVDYRLIVEHESSAANIQTPIVTTVDHLKQFETYVIENIGDTNIIREELLNVMR